MTPMPAPAQVMLLAISEFAMDTARNLAVICL